MAKKGMKKWRVLLDIDYTVRYTDEYKERNVRMDNRERIMECALDLFYQRGYDAVGIQEICNEAGVTKPTLYHYFGSKYGLLKTLLECKLSGYMEALEKASEFHGDMNQALYAFATELIDFANENHKAYMLMMNLCYSAKENETFKAAHPYIIRIYNLAVRLFEQAASQLGNMHGRQEQFAVGFVGLINHYILFLCFRNPVPAGISEGTKRSLIHQFMHGIYS